MGSKSQDKLFKMLRVCFYRRHMNNAILDYRPSWMKSPITGKNLEIDIWLPSLNMGVEYQGAQHYFKVDRMPINIESITRNDMLKYELFKRHKTRFKKAPSLVLFFEGDLRDNPSEILDVVSFRVKQQAKVNCIEKCMKMIEERKKRYTCKAIRESENERAQSEMDNAFNLALRRSE